HLIEDGSDGSLIEEVALKELDAVAEVFDALKILGAGPANHAADAVALLEQPFRQVTAILSGDAGYESGFACHGCPRDAAHGAPRVRAGAQFPWNRRVQVAAPFQAVGHEGRNPVCI